MRLVSVVLGIACVVNLPCLAGDAPAPVQEEPESDGLLTRAIRKFFSDSAEKGPGIHVGPFLPRIEIKSGSGVAPLLHLWVPDLGPIDVLASAGYSSRRYQYYELRVGMVPHVDRAAPRIERGTTRLFPLTDLDKSSGAPGFGLWVSARYRDRPGEPFYGLGLGAEPGQRSDYRLRDETYEGASQYQAGRVTVTVRGALLRTSIAAGTDPGFPDTNLTHDDTTAPGLGGGLDFLRLAGGLWFEARDQPHNPHRGVALGLAVSRFDDRDGQAFQWNRFSLDARQYVSLGSPRHVIALRQVLSLDEPDAGSRVPFFLQATAGGSDLLGGYSAQRFRDHKLMATAIEYRFELHPKVELALIHEAGQVAGSVEAFTLDALRHSYGGGIRLKSPHDVKLRVDVLHSLEGTLVHVELSSSF